jgi:hypothetical protein
MPRPSFADVAVVVRRIEVGKRHAANQRSAQVLRNHNLQVLKRSDEQYTSLLLSATIRQLLVLLKCLIWEPHFKIL